MFDRIKAILVNDLHVDAAEVTPEAELINDLGINSLELADLVYACEEEFGFEIEDEDLREFITVGDVVKYLEERVK
ncbi:MAG: acyl carrier protein [Clostridia bacterium]|mgnify:CR=1 FL=1|nr:acyl carrier protein [Clostridia bacterium]